MPNKVTVTIDGQNKLKPVLDQAGNQLGSFESTVGKVGTALKGLAVGYLVKQLVDFAGSTLDVADNLNKMSHSGPASRWRSSPACSMPRSSRTSVSQSLEKEPQETSRHALRRRMPA
jgi:hypothetical protein